MVMLHDGGGGGPILNPKAKNYERELFKVFAVDTGSISLTQTDWQDAKKQLRDLAKDVRAVRSELEAPTDGSKGWSGPAATAALASLDKLGSTLDDRAAEIGDVDRSLGGVYQAVSDAKAAWYSDVSSISTYVDPDDHMRLPTPHLPTQENRDKYSVRDPEAAAAAEDALWEQRNRAAKRILDKLGVATQRATGEMPIDVSGDAESPYQAQAPAGRGPGNTNTATHSAAGLFQTTNTGVVIFDAGDDDSDGTGGTDDDPVVVETEGPDPTVIDNGDDETGGNDDDIVISSDGEVTGSTGLAPGAGPIGSQGGPSGGGAGGLGAGGVAAGGVGGAAGLGGLLGRRGGGGMFSSGGTAGVAGSARGNGAGARGASGRSGAAGIGRPGGPQLIPGGGSGASARGGAPGRASAVKGATASGRYGVPKFTGTGSGVVAAGGGMAGKGASANTSTSKSGARAGGGRGGTTAGAVGGPGRSTSTPGPRGGGGRGGTAVGAVGSAGARRSDDKAQTQDVDRLTHEDEEAWFDGTEESSPSVWE
ncbi:hypothetical protein N802_01320 [Knoellia sinensis KCTC 19936]|uniref:PPE family domain-containing protein n=1 Tax=Knoellia sinensis KCTC 19936 TaxID=1385520 RepID=A0A0A0JHC1_9MICO|nr:hypothetical protein [Knoellia sinensis]KGN35016.1 hypothetical protein N802_01320 [Knoellia sinensis KCTC 19936]